MPTAIAPAIAALTSAIVVVLSNIPPIGGSLNIRRPA